MLVNKDLNLAMRGGRFQRVRKQNDSGLVVGLCLFLGFVLFCAALLTSS